MLFFIDLSFLFMTLARKVEAEVKIEDGVNMLYCQCVFNFTHFFSYII